MDVEENDTLCTHSLILVLVVFVRCIIKTRMVLVQSPPIAHFPQLSTHVRSYLHVECANIYISTLTYTQKHKHNHVFKHLLIDWSTHLTKLDGVR